MTTPEKAAEMLGYSRHPKHKTVWKKGHAMVSETNLVRQALKKIQQKGSNFMENTILKHFTYANLPEPLQDVSKRFCDIAVWVEDNLPPCAEKSVALRKLLEAKDAAVRARLEEKPEPLKILPDPSQIANSRAG
jgi:hypothetical protein